MPDTIADKLRGAKSFNDLCTIFRAAFKLEGANIDPEAYKAPTSDYGLKSRGKKTRERLNAQCRDIIERVTVSENLTDEEREILLQYSGRGGLTENSQYEYYTPTFIAEGVWDAMKANGFENGNVLDPCCGAGVFSGTKPEGVIVTGNDLDPVGSKVAALLNPSDSISTDPFETVVMNTADDTFDSCVGNVPFGNARGASMHEDPAYKKEKLIERYFLLRILDKIKPGGLACLVVPTNIVGAKGKRWEEFRIAVSKKAEFLGAHKLPSKSFSAQGTDTVVDIVVLRKHSRDFIDRMDEYALEALRESNVLWEEFISGKYWQGEGRKTIMGKYVPKVEGDRWSREVVDGDIDSSSIRQKLARTFHSRIDWDTLNLSEPVTRSYANGDRKGINGVTYEMRDGLWETVTEVREVHTIDAEQYGAKSREELEGILSSAKGGLSLSLKQAFAVHKNFPELLSGSQKDAVIFAMSQRNDALREQLYRGSIIGGMVAAMAAKADADSGDSADISHDRAELQDLIVAEIDRFGHPKNNKKLLLAGEGSRGFGMFKNAMDEYGNFSDLLAGTLEKAKTGAKFNAADPSDIVNHLFVREGQEDIFLEDVQALYKGTGKIESLGDLAERENLAITPDGRIMPTNRYCSGYVFEKMAACGDAIADATDQRLKDKFVEQVKLMNQRHTHTASEDITFSLRHKWLSRKYAVEFLHGSGYRDISYGVTKDVEVEQYDGSFETKQQFVRDYDAPDGDFNGPDKQGFDRQFLKYLQGDNVTSSSAENKEEYLEKVRSLEAEFNVWMQQHVDITDITQQYNRQFNNFVPFEYEGDDLGIEDYLSGNIIPHSYQNAEVRRLSEQGSGICGFGVGLGKSFTSLATVAYNHKKGRTKRTCLVVPSAVLENWYHEACHFYADDFVRNNILFVGIEPKRSKEGVIQRRAILDEHGKERTAKDGKTLMQDVVVFRNSKQDVYDAMWSIPQSNRALVVMTKEKFASIPLRPSTKEKYTDEMVGRALMSERMADKVNKPAGKKSYQEDKELANLQGKFADGGTKKKGELPFLEDMGFDSIITDESHFFKNSFEAGKKSQGYAYLPTAPASQIAIDMAIKSHYLRGQNGGRGVYGLTATPVTNSPFEIFNMLSLVAPMEEFERFGVQTVDDFVRVFGKIETVLKMSVSGEIKDTLGLVGFQNLDGLRNLFHKYVNVKSVNDVENEIHVPDAVEHEENVTINEEQADIYEKLRARAVLAAKGRMKGAGASKQDSIFSIIRDMDRLTTDLDMYNRTMTFVFPDKHLDSVKKLVELLPETYERTEKDGEGRSVTKVFDTESVIDTSGEGTFNLIVPDIHENTVLMHLTELGINESEVSHPVMPKYAKLIENMRTHFESGGKQIVFTEEKTQHKKIARILVHHLPIEVDKIGIINAEDAAGAKLDAISKAFNAGQKTIIIANKKAEVGVNLQKGTTAIHHLTLPWTPASINQRNGRGVRQGNNVASVAVYYYCGKGTFDSYRKDLLKAKSGWINDLLMGDAVQMENGDVTGMDEMLDMLADNPEEAKRQRNERLAKNQAKKEEARRTALCNTLQRLVNIDKDIAGIDDKKEARRTVLNEQVTAAERSIANAERAIERSASDEEKEKAIERLRKAKVKKEDALHYLDGLDKAFEKLHAKFESNRKMAVGTLRQADREGRLPFDVSLIDKTSEVLVSTSGEIFAVGDMYEFGDNMVVRVDTVYSEEKSLILQELTGNKNRRAIKLQNIPKHTKVSYSTAEIALKNILAMPIKYSDIVKEGLTKEQFLEHRDSIEITPYGTGVVYELDGQLEVHFGNTFGEAKGKTLAWPDVDNPSFQKAVCSAFLREKRKAYVPDHMLLELFGRGFQSMSEQYSVQGTESEILAELSKGWDDYVENKNFGDSLSAKYKHLQSSSLVQNIAKFALEKFDNKTDIISLAQDYTKGKVEVISRLYEEGKAAAERAKQEELKADTRYKEVPEDIRKSFADNGITIVVNTKEAYIAGYMGRGGTTHEPFSRWFLQDERYMGRLYNAKDIIKARYSAKFTKEWAERSGAWWHVSSDVKLKELFDIIC